MKHSLSLFPERSVLLCIDLQEEHRQDRRLLAVEFDRVIGNVVRLQEAARRNGIPVYHFAYIVDPGSETTLAYHPRLPDGRSAFSDKDDPLTAICREVEPAEGERLVVKSEASAFGTGLGDELKAAGVEWLFIAGVWTEACIDASVKAAMRLGFRVVLIKDACGSGSIAMHQIGILNLANRLYGGGVVDTERACRLMAGETVEAWTPGTPVPIRYGYEDASEIYRSL